LERATSILLELADVDSFYGRAQALHRISLEVHQGEIVALMGANGAGKTTTLMTISGIIRTCRGKIIYQNRTISKEKPATIVKQGIAHCPEGRALFPNMTVSDNLRLGAYLRRDPEGIDRDLESVYHHFPRLKERKRQLAGSLSGGEQQMLAIGRALMSSPKLLLLDEPSLGLSPLLLEEILHIIQDIHRQGTSVLLVEQNVGAALEVAHWGYILESGKISFSGSQEELVHNDQVRRAYLGG